MTTTPLHPRIREVLSALAEAQRETDAFCATITAEQESRRLGDGWTVAQVVEHMAIVENGAGRIVSNIAKQVVAVPETSEAPIAPALARYRVADPTHHKVLAPEAVQPTQGVPVAESAARMRESRTRLVAALERASGTALGAAHFPHPIFGPLDGYQWALLAAQHQHRHLVQIRHILAS
jgi:DinB superfamily